MNDQINAIGAGISGIVLGWFGAQRYALYALGKLNERYAASRGDAKIASAKLEAINDAIDLAVPLIPRRISL